MEQQSALRKFQRLMKQESFLQSPFMVHCQENIDINGKQWPTGYWQLVLHRSALRLWLKGIRANRHYRLKHTKEYFGITGNAESMYSFLDFLCLYLDIDRRAMRESDNSAS